MAHNEIHVDAPPEAVFAVLADPRSFARWVVGSRKIRSADPEWPATGTTFDHAVGVGPFTLADSTTVQQREPPRLLKMLVRARPLTQAVVTLQLRRAAEGTLVVMDEHPADLRSRILFNPLVQPLVRVRNAESCVGSRRSPKAPSRSRTARCPPGEARRRARSRSRAAPDLPHRDRDQRLTRPARRSARG